jgi:hypothetical protein
MSRPLALRAIAALSIAGVLRHWPPSIGPPQQWRPLVSLAPEDTAAAQTCVLDDEAVEVSALDDSALDDAALDRMARRLSRTVLRG